MDKKTDRLWKAAHRLDTNRKILDTLEKIRDGKTTLKEAIRLYQQYVVVYARKYELAKEDL